MFFGVLFFVSRCRKVVKSTQLAELRRSRAKKNRNGFMASTFGWALVDLLISAWVPA